LPVNAGAGQDPAGPGRAIASRIDVFGDGGGTIVLQNSRLTAIVSPEGGGRLVALGDGDGTHGNATDATGALCDDLLPAQAPTARDYIAAYTHGYPNGTAERRYDAAIVESGARAVVRLHYTDITARRPVTYERILTLEAASPRLIVDERITISGGPWSPLVRAVQRSSLPNLLYEGARETSVFPVASAARNAIVAGFVPERSSGHVTVVDWAPGDIASAVWTPYRSTGTLALTMAAGVWHRIVYAYAAVPSLTDARAFAEAERAWVSANPMAAR
jgi:hypothetical protein